MQQWSQLSLISFRFSISSFNFDAIIWAFIWFDFSPFTLYYLLLKKYVETNALKCTLKSPLPFLLLANKRLDFFSIRFTKNILLYWLIISCYLFFLELCARFGIVLVNDRLISYYAVLQKECKYRSMTCCEKGILILF